MTLTFNELNTGSKQGINITPIIDLSAIRRVKSAVINFTAALQVDTSLAVGTNVSLDGGDTWLGWTPVLNGEPIPNLPLGTDVSQGKLQIRHTLTSNNTLNLPVVKTTSVTFTPAYLDATWISKAYMFEDMTIDKVSSTISTVRTLNDGDVKLYIRTMLKDGTAYGEWVDQSDGAFVETSSVVQFKFELAPDITLSKTPTVSSLNAVVLPLSKSGTWISDLIDVSNTTNKASGKASVVSTILDGKVIVYSRSSPTTYDTPSEWCLAFDDGTLSHPAGNYIQLLVYLEGEEVSVGEVTLILDGEAQVTQVASNLTPNAQFSYTTLRDKLISANGKELPLAWDGIEPSMTPVDGAPILKYVTTHHNRVWGVSAENQSRVHFSEILDPETWDDYDFIDFNPEDGDYITALIRYGQNLIVSKQRSMAMLTGNKVSNYQVSWLDSEQGCQSQRAICSADKYIAYIAQDGIRFTDLSQSVVATERLSSDWERVNKRRLSQASMIYWQNKLFISLPVNESLINNEVWVYDFLRNSWSIREGWSVSTWLRFNQYGADILLAGDSKTGQLYQVDITEYDDGIPVEYVWRSKDFHFGVPERYKLFRNIFLDISAVADTTTLYVDLIVDGKIVGTYATEIIGGAGEKTTRRILPPLYDAVLGSSLSVQVRGRCGIQGITIEYVVRGAIPGGEL